MPRTLSRTLLIFIVVNLITQTNLHLFPSIHPTASCNNLSMVRFLVESGACLFASTLSDHETPAEKCEEDEEGFDGCSEYLYSKFLCEFHHEMRVFMLFVSRPLGIQEKLGILNSGEVYSVFSYDAQQTDEIKFSVNDKLTILRKGDEAEREWWWARNDHGQEGYVPRNLFGVSIMKRSKLSMSCFMKHFLLLRLIHSCIHELIHRIRISANNI
jgi:hypothetical protein